jgi:hypothetical protein
MVQLYEMVDSIFAQVALGTVGAGAECEAIGEDRKYSSPHARTHSV